LSGRPQLGLTLESVQRATNLRAAEAISASATAGSGWHTSSVRAEGVRLEPGVAYWATYRVSVERRSRADEAEQRRLILVARSCFTHTSWDQYAEELRGRYGDAPCRPLDGLGHPVIQDDVLTAWWFYPVDPRLPTLAAAADPRTVRRLLAPRFSPKTPPARISIDSVRYLPEISAALRYRVTDRPGEPERVVFGKLYRGDRGRELHDTMQGLWRLAQSTPTLLSVVEPLSYDDELGLHLEKEAPGEPVAGDRTHPQFQHAAVAAAEALAVMHDSTLSVDARLDLDPEIARLDEVTHQMSLVDPEAGRLLRDVVVQLRARISKTPPEQLVFTHGDMKYDQFLEAAGGFTLVDFEEVGVSETSWDLGKWCAHAMPSMPESWEDTDAAERARAAFLTRYLELRPAATRGRFPIYEATHLANRAMVLMWGQHEGWDSSAASLLTLAMERLQTSAP
jgi:aminoglycoside phosphotransferase